MFRSRLYWRSCLLDTRVIQTKVAILLSTILVLIVFKAIGEISTNFNDTFKTKHYSQRYSILHARSFKSNWRNVEEAINDIFESNKPSFQLFTLNTSKRLTSSHAKYYNRVRHFYCRLSLA